VPVVEHPDGRVVYESVVVCQYLEDVYPELPLTPTDPYWKARDSLLVEHCDRVTELK
jgi:glutathione S-transferase